MGSDALWSHETEFAPHVISVVKSRRFVSSHLVHHGIPQLVDDLQLVVSELATNAVQHAQTPFTVALQSYDHSVLLEVRDGSSLSGPLGVAFPPLDTTGRGLALVQLLSREWGVTTSVAGKTIWATFDRRLAPPGAPPVRPL